MPPGVTLRTEGAVVEVSGPLGVLTLSVPKGITVRADGQEVGVGRKGDGGNVRALHGFFRASLSNAIVGVSRGWTKTLELSGVGYRASTEGTSLVLTVGFSHPVRIEPPEGITFVIKEGKIVVSGTEKQSVGQVAASIRAVKKPEPYKGKGIRYQGEYIRKKAGKSAKAVGGAPGAGGAK